MYQIFRVVYHRLHHHRLVHSNPPDYTVVEGQFFPTVTHPRGWSDRPEYELRNDGKIYRSAQHPLGAGLQPDYEIREDCLLYRTPHHPDGSAPSAEYELREMAS